MLEDKDTAECDELADDLLAEFFTGVSCINLYHSNVNQLDAIGPILGTMRQICYSVCSPYLQSSEE